MSSRVLVTGGSGFIGTNVVESFLRAGRDVRSLDLQPPQNPDHRGVFRQVDLLDANALAQEMASFAPEDVVHLAARTDLRGADLSDYRANTDGVRNLIDALTGADVRRCLFISTKLVCRNDYAPKSFEDYCPDTIYGRSKMLFEQIVKSSDSLACEWLLARPTGIWGPWFSVPYRGFFEMVARGRYFHPGGTDAPKSFGYVGNVVYQIEALLAAARRQVHGKTFYLSDYEPTVIRRWAELISQATRRRGVRTIPGPVLRVAALAGDVLQSLGWKNPPLTSFRLRNMRADTSHIPLDNLRAVVGPLPYTLKDGVAETLAWMRREGILSAEETV